MCGILGLVAKPGQFSDLDLQRGILSLHHRGPDAQRVERVFKNSRWEAWFAHSRLSILDLTEAGTQPMWGETLEGISGSLVFNGEVYNHTSLRRRLDSSARYAFCTRTDTEVLLAGLLSRGSCFLKECNAMMSLALLLPHESRILLARDRLGKKPLFVYESDNIFAFASELKAFHALGLPLTADEEGWAYYHWLRYIPWNRTCYKECRKFPAASFAYLDLAKDRLHLSPPELFWDPFKACATVFPGNYDEALVQFSELLDDSTRLRLDADVPVGLFLSGGIDSSLVASSIVRQSKHDVTAFIVKPATQADDESDRALQTANLLGLKTEVIDLRLSDYARQVEKVAQVYDDPCSALSQLAVLAMSEAAKKHVTVVLTGDGGDEVFLGYPWLAYPDKLWRYRTVLERFPGAVNLAKLLLESRFGKGSLYLVTKLLGRNTATLNEKWWIARDLLNATSKEELYVHFQQIQNRGELSKQDRELIGSRTMLNLVEQAYPDYGWELAKAKDTPEYFACHEMVTGMRDEILVKVDRGTMAHSLEARSPLLDYRIVEFGLSLPISFKAKDGVLKRLLRDVCAQRLDSELASLKKSGFGIPVPPNLPPGPTDTVKWSRGFEEQWWQTWHRGEDKNFSNRQ